MQEKFHKPRVFCGPPADRKRCCYAVTSSTPKTRSYASRVPPHVSVRGWLTFLCVAFQIMTHSLYFCWWPSLARGVLHCLRVPVAVAVESAARSVGGRLAGLSHSATFCSSNKLINSDCL
jgi:hypothetical protein